MIKKLFHTKKYSGFDKFSKVTPIPFFYTLYFVFIYIIDIILQKIYEKRALEENEVYSRNKWT